MICDSDDCDLDRMNRRLKSHFTEPISVLCAYWIGKPEWGGAKFASLRAAAAAFACIPPCGAVMYCQKARRLSERKRHCETSVFGVLHYMASDKTGLPFETPAHTSGVTGRSAADDSCSSSERFQEIAQIANHVVSECLAARRILLFL